MRPTPVTEFTATITQLAERRSGPGPGRCCGTARRPPGSWSPPSTTCWTSTRLTFVEAPKALALNDIAQVTLRTAEPLPVEAYRPGGAVGSLLIIDPADGTTLSAGMVGDRRAALHPETPAPSSTTAAQEESA